MSVKVSVIIPVYNGEKFLHRAIQSVLDQTYKDIEIIIVDDGSTDSSPQILRQFEETDNVKVLYRKENAGQASANNFGLKHAAGEYVTYLDCDDTINPNKLALQAEYLEKNPDVGLVYSDVCFIDEVGNSGKVVPNNNERRGQSYNNGNALLITNFIVRSSVMHRMYCIEEIGFFDEGITGSDDHDMWVRIAERFLIKKIESPLVNKIHHGQNISIIRKSRKYYYYENSIHIIKKAYDRRGNPFQLKVLSISRKVRVAIIKNLPDTSENLFSRAINRMMFWLDWSIYLFLPKLVVQG